MVVYCVGWSMEIDESFMPCVADKEPRAVYPVFSGNSGRFHVSKELSLFYSANMLFLQGCQRFQN